MMLKKTTFAIRLTTKCILMLGSTKSCDTSWETSEGDPNVVRVDVRGWYSKVWNYISKNKEVKQ